MKALFLGFTAVLLVQTAKAQDVFTYFPVLVEQSNAGRYCPELSKITAVNQRQSLEGDSIVFNYRAGITRSYKYTHNSRQCMSDMVCITSNYYDVDGDELSISLERNNDGQYPTSDLAGYSMMTVMLNTSDYPSMPTCRYMLNF